MAQRRSSKSLLSKKFSQVMKKKSTASGSVSNFGGLNFGAKIKRNNNEKTSVSISEMEY